EDRVTPAVPTVTMLDVTTGPAAGGTPVTVSGTNFIPGVTVKVGTNAGTNVSLLSGTELTVDSPAGSGTVDVTVTTSGGTSATNPNDQFTYQTSTSPVVTVIDPTFGPLAGGTLVTVTGSGFTAGSTVDFGTVAGTNVTFVDAGQLTVKSPP